MPILSHPAFGPRTALGYVTGGTLLCVWTIVWYATREHEITRSQWFWLAGLFFSGTTFIFLGLVLGPIGRAARQAELPPHAAIQAEAAIQQTAAGHPPAVVAQPMGGGMPAVPAAAVPTAMPATNPAMPPASAAQPVSIAPAQ